MVSLIFYYVGIMGIYFYIIEKFFILYLKKTQTKLKNDAHHAPNLKILHNYDDCGWALPNPSKPHQ
jgi:hypothetical protein